MVVHGDDFTLCGVEEDLLVVQGWMKSWFDIKVRGILGGDPEDCKEISIWGRVVRWTLEGLEFEADPKHREKILEYFGFDSITKPLANNGDKED